MYALEAFLGRLYLRNETCGGENSEGEISRNESLHMRIISDRIRGCRRSYHWPVPHLLSLCIKLNWPRTYELFLQIKWCHCFLKTLTSSVSHHELVIAN